LLALHSKKSVEGAWLSSVNHLNFGGHNHIPGTADRLRRCQLSSPAMLMTSTVESCIQQLGE